LKTLIVNADDFGITHSVNEAIVETFERGSVSSTTLMVNAGATDDAVNKARRHPNLGVGLHFNLTLGQPVSDINSVRTLVDASGDFYTRGEIARRMLLRRINRMEIERELLAQFERIRALGLRPTHIDSHQHVHAFPWCFDAIASLCKREQLPMRMPWILKFGSNTAPIARKVRQQFLRRMLSRNQRVWDGLVRWNDGFGSVFDLGTIPEHLATDHYRAILESSPAGIFELMVHPAREADELEGLTQIGRVSENEWRFLCSDCLPALISELGFTLGSYRSL
tara:strand:+ start:7359 stop:8201 length:843 start_codon:yes stop_codon:yes gene_type:complete